MNKIAILLYAVLPALVAAGCQADGVDRPDSDLDVVYVSEHISGEQTYDINLNRENTVFFLAPSLDVKRLTVTCPTGPTLSFANYVDLRIRPTGVAYDPAATELLLANGVVPQYSLDPVVQVVAAAGSSKPQTLCTCRDDTAGNEYCSCDTQILVQ